MNPTNSKSGRFFLRKASSVSERILLPTNPSFLSPMSPASFRMCSAVSMLLRPGSTTTRSRSTAMAVPRPRCSRPASMSSTMASSRARTRWRTRAFRRVLSGQIHPPPPVLTPPSTMSLTPSTSTESFSGRSSTLGFSLKNDPMVPTLASVRSSIMAFISEMGVISASLSTPRACARLASGSASMASTFLP